MANGKYCTVMHRGRPGIDGGVHLCLLDGVKSRYGGTFLLMRRLGPIALNISAITDDGTYSEDLKSVPTLVSPVIFKSINSQLCRPYYTASL